MKISLHALLVSIITGVITLGYFHSTSQKSVEHIKHKFHHFTKMGDVHLNEQHSCGYDHIHERLTRNNPEAKKAMDKYLEGIPQMVEYAENHKSSSIITVPVVFHIINDSSLPVTDADVAAEIDVLNANFSATNNDFAATPDRWKDVVGNAGIRFCLAELDAQNQPSTGIERYTEFGNNVSDSYIENTIKPASFTQYPTSKYLNIWIIPIWGTPEWGGVAGFAYLPSGYAVGQPRDGVVTDNNFVGTGSSVITHEVGHYLGLPHTFSGDCGSDDGLSDTPNQATPTSNAPGGGPSCNGGGYPMGPSSCGEEHIYVNYMDYSSNSCVTSFTNQQIAVMRAVLTGSTASPTTGTWISRAPLAQNAAVASSTCFQSGGGGVSNPGGGGPVVVNNDAGIIEIVAPNGKACDGEEVTPVILFSNQVGENELTSARIKHKVNGMVIANILWSGNLEKGESELVTLQSFTAPSSTFEFEVEVSNPNGEQDDLTINDKRVIEIEVISVEQAPISEDYESGQANPSPAGLTTVNPDNDIFKWEVEDAVYDINVVTKCLTIDNYSSFNSEFGVLSAAGTQDLIQTTPLDFSNLINAELSFDVAYRPRDPMSQDTLEVRISTDCGATFPDLVYKKWGLDLSAVGEYQDTYFTPLIFDWRNERINLTEYQGVPSVTIAIINKSANGNAIYIDNINIEDGCLGEMSVTSQDPNCANECDGSIQLNITGLNPGAYTVEWDGPVGNITDLENLDNLCEGDYSVTVTDAIGCTLSETIILRQPLSIETLVSTGNTTAVGGNDGFALLTITGGSGMSNNFPAVWSNGDTGYQVTGLEAGTYYVTVTDDRGCMKVDSAIIFDFECTSVIDIDVTKFDVTCFDASDGAVSASAGGGNSPYFYQWSNGAISNMAGGLDEGTYTLTVTDAKGCTGIEEVNITQPPSMSLSINKVDQSSQGAPDGELTAVVSGGAEPYLYNWSTNEFTSSITGLGGGTYTVTITDDNGCTVTGEEAFPFSDCTGFDINLSYSNIGCTNLPFGIAEVDPAGGDGEYSTIWTNFQDVFLFGPEAPGLSPGTYTVSVTDGGDCEVIETFEITSGSPIDITPVINNASGVGISDGSILLEPVGNGPFTYEWADSDLNGNFNENLSPGIYPVTIYGGGCITSFNLEVEAYDCDVLNVNSTKNNITCNGDANGSISIEVMGGVPPIEYIWTNGATTPNQSNLDAGSYQVQVSDASGCGELITISIFEPSPISLSFDKENISAFGLTDGEATAIASGGTGTFSYAWSNSQNTATIDNLAPGTYTVTVTDQNNCTLIDEVVIDDLPNPCLEFEIDANVTNILCFGEQTGRVSIDASGGLEPYNYSWNTGETSRTRLNLFQGSYAVTVTDANDCTSSIEVDVTAPTIPFTVDVSSTPVSGNGNSDGTATANSSGGMGTIAYLWSNSETTQTISGLTAGTYSVTVSDENGCIAVNQILVEETSDPCAALALQITTSDTDCFDAATGSATVNPQGGTEPYSYLWSNGNTTATADNLAAGDYSVEVTDELGCTTSMDVQIGAPDEIIVQVTATAETEVDANDGTINLDVSGGTGTYTYNWENSISSNSATNLEPGTYLITITDENNCSKLAEVIIEEYDCSGFSIDFVAENVLCNGDQTGFAQISTSGGEGPFTYMWNNEDLGDTQSTLAAGTYNIEVADSKGCIQMTSITINDAPALDLNINSTNVSSSGAMDGTATAVPSGGTGEFSYLWNTDETTASINNLASGTYMVTVTDENDCTIVDEVTISEIVDPCAGFETEGQITNLTCFGDQSGEINVVPIGGTEPYNYEWSDGVSTTNLAQNLDAGTYSVSVIDQNDCISILEFEVEQPDQLIVQLEVTDETLLGENDGTASVTVSGGTGSYTYSWSTDENGADINNLPSGMYSITVTDENNCAEEYIFEIEAGADPCANFEVNTQIVPVSCNGENDGQALVVISSLSEEYTVEWEDGQTGLEATNLPAGAIGVTVTDGYNCSSETVVSIEEPATLDFTVDKTDVSLPNAADGTASITINTGGTGPFTYSWSTNETGNTITNLSPGTYNCIITDANECTTEVEVIILDADDPCIGFAVQEQVMDVSCNGGNDGTIQLELIGGTAPFTANWDNEATGLSLEDLESGTYVVTITDENGCPLELSIDVNQPDALAISLNAQDESMMGENDGAITSTVEGGTSPYMYAWDNGMSTQDISDLPPGIYTLVVTDANGCSTTNEVEVQAGAVGCAGFSASAESTMVSCNGDSNGTITVSPAGGTEPYNYDWSHASEIGATATDLPAGQYSVTVTDQEDCSTVIQAEVTEPAVLVLSLLAQDESSQGENDGAITSTVEGGTSPYMYAWDNGMSTQDISDLPPGIYTLVVTDANGCSTTNEVEVQAGAVGCAGFSASAESTMVSCNGDSNGTITVSPAGGTEPYNYDWSHASEIGATATDLPAGQYSVTVTDQEDCSTVIQAEVSEPAVLVLSLSAQDESSQGENDGAITAMVEGGTSPYMYAWDNGMSTQDISDLPPGIYTLVVTDANGCSSTNEVEVQAGAVGCAGFSANAVTTMVSCNGDSDGTITVSPAGGTEPYSYDWSHASEIGATATDLSAGQYSVTVTDQEDCSTVIQAEVTEPAAIQINLTAQNESSPNAGDGAVITEVTGGTGDYTFVWDNGMMTQDISDLPSGIYIVVITDENGCTATSGITVEEGPVDCGGFMVTYDIRSVSCNGGSDGEIVLNPVGGSEPYDIVWLTGLSGTNQTGLVAGDYELTVTDQFGCEEILILNVEEPEELEISMEALDSDCGDGAIAQAIPTGGTGPYSYLWSNGMEGAVITGLETGNYEATITDANGCTQINSVDVVNNPSQIAIDVQHTNVSCNGGSDGSISTTVGGGIAPYTFEWSNGANTSTIENIPAGSYTLFITDAEGCSYGVTQIVEEPSAIMVDIEIQSGAGNQGFIVNTIVQGGIGPHTYLWEDGSTFPFNENLTVGEHAVIVTDANGCEVVHTFLIDPTISVNDLDIIESLAIFPNPVRNQLSINASLSRTESVNIRLLNILGQEVFIQTTNSKDIQLNIDVADLVEGTYFVNLQAETGQISRKIVVIH